MSENAVTALFVYGTLKTTGVRSGLWPFSPIEVAPATIQATLFDLGPYPAIYPGNDSVAGEKWRFQAWQMLETLAVLDRVEGFNQEGRDLYVRETVECQLVNGEKITAYSYFYAEDPSNGGIRVEPSDDGLCRWPTE